MRKFQSFKRKMKIMLCKKFWPREPLSPNRPSRSKSHQKFSKELNSKKSTKTGTLAQSITVSQKLMEIKLARCKNLKMAILMKFNFSV
jgi:hypothetical protein